MDRVVERMLRVPGFHMLAIRYRQTMSPHTQYKLLVDIIVALQPSDAVMARLVHLRRDVLDIVRKQEEAEERLAKQSRPSNQVSRPSNQASRPASRPSRPASKPIRGDGWGKGRL